MTVSAQRRPRFQWSAQLAARVVGAIAVVVALGAAPLAAAAAGHPQALTGQSPTVAGVVHAGLDDFVFDSYDGEFFLDRDSQGHSTLLTSETFVAVFPPDQNRGMLRAVPRYYKGEPVEVGTVSVTDETGQPRDFEVEEDGEFTLITSAASSFVEGPQTYVFTYTRSNVTRFAADTGADEFYWDTNGTGWNQPFGSLTATIHLGEGLSDALGGEPDCYWGIERSTERCDIVAVDDDTYVATQGALQRGQNVTVAFGFEPGTFVPRDSSYFGSAAGYGQPLGFIGAIAAVIWAFRIRRSKLADDGGRPTIIAEYSPPRDISVVTAALVIKKRPKAVAAQILDFAVRGKLRILEEESKGFFSSGTTYRLELMDPTGVTGRELEILRALFGQSLQHGAIRDMKRTDSKLSKKMYSILTAENSALAPNGYRQKLSARNYLPLLVSVVAVIVSIVFGIALIDGDYGSVAPFLIIMVSFMAAVLTMSLLSRTPLTAQGSELRDHLEGLKLYIRLAEADRLQMLQSPEGALRERNEATGSTDVLKIYEKLLPYAVLFGLEKEWSTELSRYYSENSPDWYRGSSGFNGVLFASSISSFSTAVASSYSGSSSSSSSGGSGGGGSSGGGGGGGGGGGV
ncbi:DUF2207 domain-containing protein [Salinibacterium sp. UTAS2018]|uniref:DUF2207 domain-containing protein n=1 Tax=Salinibacterium sp. UTAS2018 TaxID=2508880 RepID=UPI0010095E9A|nr:DUF2207 domain-containing protein [Salinibacterium sp. UTAS2018]QAV69049.1 DUF2207 domain-containing protein [Salinibacterium sp. UTAS2018]